MDVCSFFVFKIKLKDATLQPTRKALVESMETKVGEKVTLTEFWKAAIAAVKEGKDYMAEVSALKIAAQAKAIELEQAAFP